MDRDQPKRRTVIFQTPNIPLVNIVTSIVVSFDLAKVFGKSGVFAVFGLIIFSLIGYLILGFGDAEYTEPAAA